MTHACGCQHGSSLDSSDDALAPVRPEQTVGEIIRRHAGALEIMQRMGVNHCCGAALTLSEAAASAGIPLAGLLSALNEARKARA